MFVFGLFISVALQIRLAGWLGINYLLVSILAHSYPILEIVISLPVSCKATPCPCFLFVAAFIIIPLLLSVQRGGGADACAASPVLVSSGHTKDLFHRFLSLAEIEKNSPNKESGK